MNDIKGYEGLYAITENGEVWSYHNERFLRQERKGDYFRVELWKNGSREKKWDRETKEVQAESVAYWVTQLLGMDTSDYSFYYIGGWSKNKEIPELKEHLELIKTAADKRNARRWPCMSKSRRTARQESKHRDRSE